ncbi:MAG TPA: SPOR domain-containing protein [Ignavibacteria bacterium]|nr:SPOR domain-containing protein [Ignavibacteria bacterium]
MRNIYSKISLLLPVLLLSLTALIFNSCGTSCPDCDLMVGPNGELLGPDGNPVYVQDTIKMPPVIVEEVVPYKVTIQIGAFRDRNYADGLAANARGKLDLRVDVTLDPLDGLYKVTVGTFDDVQTANNYLTTVIGRGFTDAFTRTKRF